MPALTHALAQRIRAPRRPGRPLLAPDARDGGSAVLPADQEAGPTCSTLRS